MSGPHQAIATDHAGEAFTARLFDTLWDRYRGRVSYAADYEQVVQQAGGTFVNDHVAFRTFATQRPLAGISSVSRIFEALQYRAAGCYNFPDKQLGAIHFQHPNPRFPKLFVSELKTWELPSPAQAMIAALTASHRDHPPLDLLEQLARVADLAADRQDELLAETVAWFEQRPWDVPERAELEALNAVSQYAAWVAVHGYNVNHFTSLINSHGVEPLDDIEKTVAALARAGVPMKEQIEGARGSKLRQTATAAVVIDVEVREQGRPATMEWTYAYFELAERGTIVDPDSGQETRFEGFLGPQATQLFEMTRTTPLKP